MSNFYLRNFMANCKPKIVDMPKDSTPNDFKKIMGLDDKFLPTLCYRQKNNKPKEYLSRKAKNGIAEWDMPMKEGYEYSFVVYPNADGGATEAILISLAISLIVGVATYLLTPRPNLGLNQLNNDTSPTYDLTQQGNRVRLNQPKPIHYGTIRAYPDIWSNSWTESVGENRIYHALLNVGYNYIEIADFRIDDTDLSTFVPWANKNVRYPGDAPTSYFPKPVITSKEIKNVSIEATDSGYYVLNDVNPISKVQTIHLDFVNERGIYYSGGINDRGVVDRATAANINLASLPALIDGATVTNFLAFGQLNAPDNGCWDYTGVGNVATRSFNMSSVPDFQNGHVRILAGSYINKRFRNTVRINSMADPKIFVDYDGSKTINETVMWIRTEIQPIDALGTNIGLSVIRYFEIKGASKEPFYKTFSYTHGSPQRFKVQVAQGYYYSTNPPFADNFVREISSQELQNLENKTTWIGLKGDLLASEAISPDQTLIEVSIQASGKLNDSNIGIFNCLGKVRLPVYDFGATTWSTIQTNSPIWAWYDVIVKQKYGLGLKGFNYLNISDYVDIDNLEDIYNSINLLGLECNARFDTSMTADEMLQQICNSMRAITYRRGGKYFLARAEEKTSINGFFSRENISAGSLKFELIPKTEYSPTWFRVTYYDSTTSKKETVDCVIPSALSANDQYAQPFEEVEILTITNRTKVWQYGMYLLAQSRYNNETITFETDIEGFFPNPMDFISLSHPMLTSTQSGYIQKVDGAIVYLSEPIIFLGYETGLISFKRLDGTCTPYYICRHTNNQFAVELVQFSVATNDYTAFPFLSQEDEPLTEETTFTFGVTESSKTCIVKKITPSGNNGANIEAVNHDPRVYTADKPIFLVPDLGSDYILHDAFICDIVEYQLPSPISGLGCFVNLATKLVTVKFNYSGYAGYNVRYLFDNLGVEFMQTNLVYSGVAGVKTDTYTYVGNPPSRVTVTPIITITTTPVAQEELLNLAVIVPIQLI